MVERSIVQVDRLPNDLYHVHKVSNHFSKLIEYHYETYVTYSREDLLFLRSNHFLLEIDLVRKVKRHDEQKEKKHVLKVFFLMMNMHGMAVLEEFTEN